MELVIILYRLKIRLYRVMSNYTQEELATAINTSQSFLSDIENGKWDLKMDMLFRIARVLKVCPKDLIDCTCETCVKSKTKKKGTRL